MGKVNHDDRARRAWPHLVTRAEQETDIRYAELGGLIGIHHRAFAKPLGLIQDFCLEHQLPPLTVLVVNESGRPGPGFIGAPDGADLQMVTRTVWDHDWRGIANPFSYARQGATRVGLAARLARDPTETKTVLRLVKDRGIQQQIFRDALLRNYRKQCAACGFKVKTALEAAHIRPWAYADSSERIDPRNGILLCRNHHVLFDLGFWTVHRDLRIVVGPKAHHNRRDLRIQNRVLKVPTAKAARPSTDALDWHRRNVAGLAGE